MKSLRPAPLILLGLLLIATAVTAIRPATGQQATNPTAQPTDPHGELKHQVLHLTNLERVRLGLRPLKLGDNQASQIHAETALKGCYNSHWDRWGLKPAHRLALAGSTGFNLENVIGLNDCIAEWAGYRPLKHMRTEIKEAIQTWMKSPGHRDAILNPAVNTLHVGIAHDSHNIRIVQHFEADYVTYQDAPEVDQSGILTLRGALTGASLRPDLTVTIRISYEPPPQPLERGQLASTYALCIPREVARVMPPEPNTSSLAHIKYTTNTPPCKDPAKLAADTPAPASPEESNRRWAQSRRTAQEALPNVSKGDHVIASNYAHTETTFNVTADISELLHKHGPGVYSIILTGQPDHMTDPSVLAIHPIFWGTEPPAGNPYPNR